MDSDHKSGGASLSLELLDQIAPHLDPSDVVNARLACCLFCRAFTSYLVPRLTLTLTEVVTIATNAGHHRPFTHIPDSLVGSIKELIIELSDPCLDIAGHPRRDSIIILSQKEISRLLSLVRLSIIWTISRRFLPDSSRSVGDIEERLLGAIPNPARLRHLQVGSFVYPRGRPTPLERFTHLKSFNAINIIRMKTASSSMIQEINVLLTTVPTLTTLKLDTPLLSDKILLNDLLPSSLVHSHLSLHSLHFEGSFVWPRTNSSSEDLPCLPHLRRLLVKPRNHAADDDWDGLWDLLRQTDTRLHDILVDHPPTLPFIEYLSSFEGLQQLVIPHTPPRGPTDNTFNIAAPLITRVLSLHAATLQRLVANVPCIGFHADPESEGVSFTSTWPSPTCFPNLKYLSAWSPRGWSFSLDTCQSLLDWLEQLPSLIHVGIIFPSLWQMVSYGLPEFREMGKELIGRTGRPNEWTLLYDNDMELDECTWKVERREEDSTWYFAGVEKGYDITWVSEWS